MAAINITQNELLLLEKEVKAKFEQECIAENIPIPNNSDQYYGYGENYKEGEHTCLRHYISRYPKVAEYLNMQNRALTSSETGFKKVNGKDLYDRVRKIKKEAPNSEWPLSDIYEYIYFYYLDCENITEFRKRYVANYTDEEKLVSFKAYYYSFRWHKISSFDLTLIFKRNGIEAIQKGFFDTNPDLILKGAGRLSRFTLQINLANDDGEIMDIYIHINNKKPDSADILMGLLVTQSSYQFPVSVEILLVKNSLALLDPDKYQIERYLFLKRHHLRTFDDEYQVLSDLKVKKTLIDTISFLADKTYRVWSYTPNGDIVQVKFVIEANYKTTLYSTSKLYTTSNEREQTCLLTISRAINERLIVNMHPKDGTGLIGTSILNIPSVQRANLFTGVTCGVGLRGEHPTLAYVALLNDDSDFAPDILSPKQILELTKKNSKLAELKRELDNLNQ